MTAPASAAKLRALAEKVVQARPITHGVAAFRRAATPEAIIALCDAVRDAEIARALIHEIATDSQANGGALRKKAKKFLAGHTPQIVAAMEHRIRTLEAATHGAARTETQT